TRNPELQNRRPGTRNPQFFSNQYLSAGATVGFESTLSRLALVARAASTAASFSGRRKGRLVQPADSFIESLEKALFVPKSAAVIDGPPRDKACRMLHV